jgi:predicted site-specific integrase-resolvase
MTPQTDFPRAALITQRQATAILGISHDSFARLVKAGGLEPVWMPGLGRPKYRSADVERLIAGRDRSP